MEKMPAFGTFPWNTDLVKNSPAELQWTLGDYFVHSHGLPYGVLCYFAEMSLKDQLVFQPKI